MLSGKMPSRKLFGRIGLFFVISAMFFTITAAGANAAGFSFVDSVKEFLGFAPTQTASVTQTAAPISAPAPDDTDAPDVVSTTLVLSQVYGGGGTSTGTYTFDYVEIKNISTSVQSLNTLSLYYASAVGNFASTAVNAFALPNVSLNPGQYYLVQLGGAGSGGAAFPVSADATTTNLGMSATVGKVALVTSGLAQNTCGSTATPCNGAQLALIVDWVAYGAAGNGAAGNGEGGTSVNNGANLTNTQGGVRKLGGCQDTDNNNVDFNVVTAPVPRNSASALAPCSFTLTAGRAGTGGGQVTSQPIGITCGADCTEAYSTGTVVQLTATAFIGSTFGGWSGDCAGQGAVCQVTMSQARSATATFSLTQHLLSVARDGTGSGTVTSNPAGISCGADCNESYNQGTVVTLTAVPGASSSFAGWTGEPCAGLPENCDVTMTQARSVTATFTLTDNTPPVVSIVSISPNPTNTGTTVTFHGDEDGDYDVRLEGTSCSNGTVVESGVYSQPTDRPVVIPPAMLAGDGAKTVFVCLRDAAGNSGSASSSFVVDRTPPVVTIESTSPNPTTSSSSVSFHGDEDGDFSVRVGGTDCDDGAEIAAGVYSAPGSLSRSIPEHSLLRGTNTVRVCLQDRAGNESSSSSSVQMQSCVATDNGTGTVDLPAQCRFLGGPMPIITPPPPGQPIRSTVSLDSFTDVVSTPGGSLGGESTSAASTVRLAFRPTAAAAVSVITMPSCPVTFDSAPRTPGSAVQSFDTEMISMQCSVSGDPDFDLLRITAGSSFGLPSPGHTTLRCASGSCSVDSFFDIDYEIDYVGKPGGPFGGMSGSTTGTIRMSQVSGPPPPSSCTAPDSGTGTVEYPPDCPMEGWPVSIVTGLPSGVTLEGDLTVGDPSSVSSSPGGSLGGTQHTFVWSSSLSLAGTGDPDFDLLRTIPFSNCPVVIDTAPRSPGDPVQSFDTEMISMQCQVTGDPDFDLLRITAGSGFGLPSPGHTTLIRESPTLWAVDSFFDVFYSVEFTGAPGGRLAGRSGSTTGTIRMQMGTPGTRSITVIKLNDTTGGPLPGWTMRLYGGPSCTGSILDTQVTNADGLVDFTGLSNADYSVAEVNQSGWTPVSGTCQAATLSGPGGGGGGGCAGGSCTSGAHMKLEIQGMPPMHITGNGLTTVQRGATCPGCGPGGRSYFDTEMLSMDLQGSSSILGPFMIRESPTKQSLGRTTQQTPGVDFPADSFFDVFFEIDSAIGRLHFGNNPDNLCAITRGYPPTNSPYLSMGSHTLYNAADQPVGFVRDLLHITLPPDEILVVFRNIPPPATATATATPTPERSITVIKLNDTTGAPLPGWTMNLYGGPGCAGPILDTQVTGSNGLADFVGLSNGDYSVAEVVQGGWTPITPVCQDMSLSGGGGGGGGGGCGSGGAGDCTSDSGVHMKLEIQGMPMQHITASGLTTVHRSSTCPGCGPDGRSYFDTEMLSMDLQGSSPILGPFMIRESPTKQSLGRTTQQTPGVDFPADSFFDVFFEIQSAAGLYHFGNNPDNICAVTSGYPPTNSPYTSMGSRTLFDAANQPVGFVHDLLHVTLPPGEILIVFRNQPPPPTATATATATATPTNTPTNCIADDNGSNTVDLPAPCRYFGGPLTITNGLPVGSSLDSAGSLESFTDVVRTPGGPLGGETNSFMSKLRLVMQGSGSLSGFHRLISIPNTQTEFHHGPRQTTDLSQSFDSEVSRISGQLPAGDPDFDLLRITAGSSFGMPSPGHTTLIRESPTLPRWSVDSFFDITYRIDFVGKPGGALSGMSGSTTATIRMSQHELRPRLRVGCAPTAAAGTVSLPAECAMQGWPMSISSGLPTGTTLQSDAFFDVFTEITRSPGGSLGGERDEFKGTLTLDMCGTGTMSGYCRPIPIPITQAVMDSAPRTPGQPVQSFDTEMFAMQGQITGDPDFDLLRITAGSGFGMPSPGHTTLRCMPGGSTCDVDSFFDITYRIDFVGRPGGGLGGMSGSTTATIRMTQGLPDAGSTPTASSTPTPSVDYCQQPVTAGQASSCGTGSEATSSDTTVTQVSIPTGAAPSSFTLSITETNNPSPPTGFSSCGQLVDISTGGVTLSSFATITFQIDSSECSSASPEEVQIFRDGVPVPDCNGSNDPCVFSRSAFMMGDKVVVCHSSHFSEWLAAVNDSSISGTVTYGNPVTGPNPRGVPNVLISGVGSPAVSDTTAAAGTYLLDGFGVSSYTITPSKSGGVNSSITSFDAGRIAQYITGNTGFTAAQQTVADVSGAGGLSSFDAALIARYVLSLGPPSGNAGTWLFTPASNVHAPLTSDITGENYSALLMGDVSGNWGDPSPFRPAVGGGGPERIAAINAPTLVTPADGEVVIPVSVRGTANKGVISYEFDLRYDPSVIQPQPEPVDAAGTISSGLSVMANAETPGLLRVVAYGATPIEGSGLLLNLRFTAVGAPGTVSPLTWERLILNEGTPQTTAADGQVELSRSLPNQAEISGRLLTTFGEGVPNSRVTLTDTTGRSRSILSNGFGIYRFGSLQVGQTYTIRVNARSFTFTPVTISVTGQIVNVDMIAMQ